MSIPNYGRHPSLKKSDPLCDANLDRLHDELDLSDDYDYEGEVSNKIARSSQMQSFSGEVSPHRKKINSESFHREIVQKAVQKVMS